MKANKPFEEFATKADRYMGKTYRSVSEANKDARYACAIQGFKSDLKLTIDFLEGAVLGFVWVMIVLGGAVSLVYFVFKA